MRALKAFGGWVHAQRFDLVGLAGAGSLGAGVWAQFGAPWAWMLWGILAIALVVQRSISEKGA